MQNQEDVRSHYRTIQSKEQEVLNDEKKKILWISIFRIASFFALIIGVYILFKQESDYTIYAAVGGIIIFLFLVKLHSKYYAAKRLTENRMRVIKEELKAVEGNQSAFDDGSRYLYRSKDYAYDLDVFGPQSLYQKCNRTTTISGGSILAQWFNFVELNIDKIKRKQEAVAELSEHFDIRLNFRAQGLMLDEEKGQTRALINWMNESDLFLGKPVYLILIWIASIVNLLGIILYFGSIIGGNIPATTLFISLMIVGLFTKKIHRIHMSVSSKVKLLSKYINLLMIIEQNDFKADYLKDLQTNLKGSKNFASAEIQKLSKILSALDTRLNVFAGILVNAIFLWDILQVLRMEKWKAQHKKEMLKWFTVLGEFDALNGLSTLQYNHPNWIFPDLSDKDFELVAKDLKHPLMQENECVGNDFSIPNRPHFKVITGANMAGKSTFLRTLGTNMLLAMMGAPVNAKAMKLNPIEIISSIRTKDSLAKNESYFYAEIKRLEVIINRLKKGDRLFVFLDEILKGTNSKDKELGSKALLKQLVSLKAVGVIATHDLNLGVISQDFEDFIENICFEVEIEDGGLQFDYKIRSGIAQNLSATYLMKQMGITL
jgi:DNA mismatch repair ATPase MutS